MTAAAVDETSALPTLLSVEEVAELLGLHRATVYELLRSGALPRVRLGRKTRIRLDAVQAFIENGGSPDRPKRRRGK